jgi:hypothetical protein
VHAPEPPNPVAEEDGWVAVPPRGERDRRPERRPRDSTAVTEMLRDRPAWEGDAPSSERTTRLGEERTTRLPDPSEERTTRLPQPPEERLFDDPSRADTKRLPEDASEARTRRQRRPADHPPLWEDEPPH